MEKRLTFVNIPRWALAVAVAVAVALAVAACVAFSMAAQFPPIFPSVLLCFNLIKSRKTLSVQPLAQHGSGPGQNTAWRTSTASYPHFSLHNFRGSHLFHAIFTVMYSIYRGWDSSAFTWISVEQKLKSVVDDDRFCGKQNDQQKKTKKSKANPVPIWLVRILSCSQVIPGCARALHCCSGFQKWPREQTSSLAVKVLIKQEWRMVGGRWQWAERMTDNENICQFIQKTWNYVLWSCLFLSIF